MSPNVSDSRENRMDTDKNASLTPKGREAMTRRVVEGGLSKAVAARQFNTTPKTVAKWVDRFQAEGPAGLMDRSSRPHSSPAYQDLRPTERRGSSLLFLSTAFLFFGAPGVRAARVMPTTASTFRPRRYAKALRRLKIKHLRTKPYTPKTNGKAERFVQTSLREWAYAQAYPTSDHRAQQLPLWLHRSNWHRPHGGIGSKPPISRLALTEDNLLRLHS